MKTAAWGAFMVSVAALAAGCGSSGSSDTGSGGAGGAETTTAAGTTTSTTTVTTTVGSGMPTTTTTGSTTTASSVTSSSSGMMTCGTFIFDTNVDCQACMTEQCCTELADCGQDCSDLFDCLGACAASDMTCSNKCLTDHQAGLNPAKALVTCFQGSCKGDMRCKTPGAICDSGLVLKDPAAQACATCLGTNCCPEFTACGNDADKSCLGCLQNPMGAGCTTDMIYQAANTCLTTKCSTECK